jgi:rSAM/selenodomain-associated transferase 2
VSYDRRVISIVVPVLNEAKALPALLHALRGEGGDFETIVVDGGSSDATPAIAAAEPSVRVLEAARGRARQMNAGAKVARGEVLLFLHADTRLEPGAVAWLDANVGARLLAGAFTHRFAPPDWRLSLVSAAHNLRCRWTRVYYGDQAIFVTKALFDAAGGFPEVDVLEDVLFCERLRPLTRARLLGRVATTDSRRFLHHGVWRSIGRGVAIVVRHRLGLRVSGHGFSDPVR